LVFKKDPDYILQIMALFKPLRENCSRSWGLQHFVLFAPAASGIPQYRDSPQKVDEKPGVKGMLPYMLPPPL
jgi:hypothetical protein